MPSDPQTLFDQAKCFGCYGASAVDLLKLALLDQIAAGGSGSCANLSGVASPLNVITPDFVGQVYVQADGTIWQAGTLLAASWVVICAPGAGSGLVWGPAATSLDLFTFGGQSLTNGFGAPVTTVQFPGLTTVTTFFELFDNTTITSIALDVLASTGSYLDVSGNTSLVSFTAPLLATIGGYFAINQALIITLALPMLVSVSGNFTAGTLASGNCPNVTSISLPSITTIGGFIDCSTNPALTSISLPSITTIGGNIDCSANPALTSFSAPAWLPTDGSHIDFNVDGLDVTSVNLILARCVASGVTACNIDLSGGTSAAPAGQGIIDKAALILAGNGVVTN
jgi:hypothetical protein